MRSFSTASQPVVQGLMIRLGNRLFHPFHVLRFRLEQAAHVMSNRGLDGPGALAEVTAEAVAAVQEPLTDSGQQPHLGVRHRFFSRIANLARGSKGAS